MPLSMISFSFDNAALSATSVISGCSCRTEAGTSGVTAPANALATIPAFSSPDTTIKIFAACMIDLISMV